MFSRNEAESRIEPSQIKRIARDDGLASLLCADHDVSIGNVRRTAFGQQQSHGLGVGSVEGLDIGLVMLDHTPERHLLRRIANDLRKNGGRDNHTMVAIQRDADDGENSAIVSLQRD